MSEKQAEYKTVHGFISPNYTQTPNDFFLMLPEMGDAELRVTLVMIRKTFGFHRDGFKMGIKKLADAAGLSRQGALTGAEQAEMRGTFKRVNPDDQGEAEWELVVPLYQEEAPLQPVEGTPPADGGQVGVKERIKKESKENSSSIFQQANRKIDAMLEIANFPGAKREIRLNAILSYLGEKLNINSSGKDWEKFAKFVDDRQLNHNEKLDTFISWMKSQPKFDMQYWSIKRMTTLWPQAFVDKRLSSPETTEYPTL